MKRLLMAALWTSSILPLISPPSFAQVSIAENGEVVTLTEEESQRLALTKEAQGARVNNDIRTVRAITGFIDSLEPDIATTPEDKEALANARAIIIEVGKRLQKKYIEAIVTARSIHQSTLDEAVQNAEILVASTSEAIGRVQRDINDLGAVPAEEDLAAFTSKLEAANTASAAAQATLISATAAANDFRATAP